MVELGRRSYGREPSPVPRMFSGNTCTSTACCAPSGPGTVVAPMKEPTLISASDILMVPRARVGTGDCWAMAWDETAISANAASECDRMERGDGMKGSPAGATEHWTPRLPRYSGSNLREIGLDQCAKCGRHFRALSEPEFEATHRLVQQHAEPVGSPQSARLRRRQQRRLQRHIDEVGDHGL